MPTVKSLLTMVVTQQWNPSSGAVVQPQLRHSHLIALLQMREDEVRSLESVKYLALERAIGASNNAFRFVT